MEVLIKKARVDYYNKGEKRDYLTLAVPNGKVKFSLEKGVFPTSLDPKKDPENFEKTFQVKGVVNPMVFGKDLVLNLVDPEFK